MPDPNDKPYDDDEAHVIRTWDLVEPPTLTPNDGVPLTFADWIEFVKNLGKTPDDH